MYSFRYHLFKVFTSIQRCKAFRLKEWVGRLLRVPGLRLHRCFPAFGQRVGLSMILLS